MLERYLDQAPDMDQPLHKRSEILLAQSSDAIALSHGYRVDFVVSDKYGTFATTFNPKTGGARVVVSPDLIARSESSEHISGEEVLGFGIAHEIGHIKLRRQKFEEIGSLKESFKSEGEKTRYFNNIIEDIAINQNLITECSYFRKRIPLIYDEILFTLQSRKSMKGQPTHKQLMEGLLVLSMISPSASRVGYSEDALSRDLKDLDMEVSPEVSEAIANIISHHHDGKQFNLLRLLKTHGMDYEQRNLVSSIIGEYYDKLYKEDLSNKSGSENGESSDDEGFDYSDSGSCGHNHDVDEENEEPDSRDDSESSGTRINEEDSSDDAQQSDKNSNEDGQSIGKSIVKEIEDAKEAKEKAKEKARQKEEQAKKEALRQNLGLNEADFNEYLKTRQKYSAEIEDFANIITMLKRERNDDLLAPSRDLRARGHRINIPSLVGAIASNTLNNNPDIFKSPKLGEKIQYEFDGLDLFLLCDVSGSMGMNGGKKAKEAAASAVVILEGLMNSAELASVDDLIRVQIQAFGSTDYMLSPLSSRPSSQALGTTYSKILKPSSMESTYVAGSLKSALSHIKPTLPGQESRLQVVGVVSDGAFQDSEAAKKVGAKVNENGGLILQFVYDGAEVVKLSDNSEILDIERTESLPAKFFELLPELLASIRIKNG